MARGDYVDVTFKTGVGTDTKRTQARSAGASVVVSMPGARDATQFITVEELNAANPPVAVQTSRFAAGEVVAIVEGSAPIESLKVTMKTTLKGKIRPVSGNEMDTSR